MKDAMVNYLLDMNKGNDYSSVTTRLYYGDKGEYVEDFSPFANENYMSKELLDALKNNRTLTSVQEEELSRFVIEASK